MAESASPNGRSGRIPRTDTLLADPRLAAPVRRLGTDHVKRAIHDVQARIHRGALRSDAAVDAVLAGLPATPTSLRSVLNATGVILHTNLGRAPLSRAAMDAAVACAGSVDLEIDLETGRRGERGGGVLGALRAAVPTAEAAHVVNNGAAALLLCSAALATGREVIVSRGELVEIGDGFRLPELIEAAGARVREVGTTNRTTIDDYRRAISPETGIVLKIHPSNFIVSGYTESVSVAELRGLGTPVVFDIGSGLLAPDPRLPAEPDARTAMADGATVVTASCDKLLGGPQGGVVLGSAATVRHIRRHPMARALRIDKLRLAALEATLTGPITPTRQSIDIDPDVLCRRAQAIVSTLAVQGTAAQVRTSVAAIGGGAAPGIQLDSYAVALPGRYAAPLRTGKPSVVGRVEHDTCLLDLRGIPAEHDEFLIEAIVSVSRAG